MTCPDQTEPRDRIAQPVQPNTEMGLSVKSRSLRKFSVTLVLVVAAVIFGAFTNSDGSKRSVANLKTTGRTDLRRDQSVNGSMKRVNNRPRSDSVVAEPTIFAAGKRQRRQSHSREGVVQIAGEVPAALARAERIHATTDGDQPLSLTVVLNRTDQRGFDEFLRGVQNPRSPSYRHYLSPRQQADRFGPSQRAYDEVSAWLGRKGFSLVEGSANRLTLTVRGMRKMAEQAFGVAIGDYRSEDKTFYANDRDPAIPTPIAAYIQAVIGFSNLANLSKSRSQPTTQIQAVTALSNLPKPTASIEDALIRNQCHDFATKFAYMRFFMCSARQFRSFEECSAQLNADFGRAYIQCLNDLGNTPVDGGNGPGGGPGLSSPRVATSYRTAALTGGTQTAMLPRWLDIDGTGQTIGLLEFDTFNVNDIRDYLTLVARPPTDINRLSQVHVNGGAALGLEEAEVLIDIIAVMTNARGANVVVYDAPFTGIRTSFQTLFNRMISDGVTVISNSWVYCEDQATLADAQTIDSVLASAAAAGITVLNSTGDFGSTCVNGSASTASLPATSPHSTAIGGTSLTRGPAGTYGGELFWNGLNQTPPTGQGGFGVSRFFSRPSYQNGFTSSSMRSIPDLSVNGDPAKGIEICQADAGGCPTGSLFGGTSLSAPLWAAFVALLNQAQGQNLGALNPLLYPLGNTDAFHTAASMGSDFQHVGLGSPNLNLIHRALSSKIAGPVSASVSENTADPIGTIADGISEAFVVVRLRDTDGHTVSGKTVTLAGNAGSHASITPASGVSNVSNGAVIFSVKDSVPEIVTFTATETTDGIVLQQQVDVAFAEPPAAAGGITANPTTVTANGIDTTTITVTLQDANGNPSPNKIVNLSQGNGASIISATTAFTDATGKVQFTAVSNKDQIVTYTAVDVTDRNLPVPGSVSVAFVNASGFCANRGAYNVGTAAPGYSVTTFASNFPIDCFSGVGPVGIAFDANGSLLVGDIFNSTLYRFGQQGGIAGPATIVGVLQGTTLGGLVFTADGRLYAALKSMNKVAELNPSTAAIIRNVADYIDPIGLAVDPISGDLFVSSQSGVARISNFTGSPGTVTPYFSGDVDGITFGADGTLYGAAFNQIIRATGTNTPMPGVVSTVAFIPNADGIAIEPNSSNPAKPILYVNRKDGIITRIDTSLLSDPPSSSCGAACTDIYTGGSRGDFVAVSPLGCLYATQSERVIKITKADGTCSLAPTNPGPQLALTPESVSPSPAQGTTVTFTAQLKNVAKPQDIPITLFVTGANPTPRLVNADANGKAVFTYTGVATGTDRAFASADLSGGTKVFSNESQVTWTAGKHSTFLTLNQSPSSGAPNQPITLTATLIDISVSPAAPMNGASITFGLAGQMCAGTTNGAGTASCSVTPAVTEGAYPLNASFAGTGSFLSSSASKTVTLIERPTKSPEEADLSVTKSDLPDPVCVQGNITYTINFMNNGPAAAPNTTVTDAVPANTTLVSVSTPAGWTRTDSVPAGGTGTIAFSKSSTASGENAVFIIVVKVNMGVTHGSVITNSAIAASTISDPTPGNNTGTTTTTVEPVPPVITCPANMTKNADPNQCSAVVSYTATATDNCTGVTVLCNPPSGSAFPKGITTVNCAATDVAGNTANCSFTVTVNDTQAPTIGCPTNMTSVTPDIGGTSAVVGFPNPTASDNCPAVSTACNPPSGSTFPVGCTTVTCTATDMSGNTASCSFQVCVFNICLQDDSNASNRILINTATGDYRFCCNGTTLTGRGKMTAQGSTFTLEHNALDRRVRASVTASSHVGNASLQMPPGKTRCVITDSDTRNDSNCGTCQ